MGWGSYVARILELLLERLDLRLVKLSGVGLVRRAHLLELLLERLDLRLELDLEDIEVLGVLHALRLELPLVLVHTTPPRLHVPGEGEGRG